MIRWWAHWRAKDTYTRVSLDSRTSTCPTQGINPFFATQSLRPWPPFQCYSGVVEKKASPLALSVWLPNTPSLSSKPIPHPHSNIVRRPTTTYMKPNKLFTSLTGENKPLNHSCPYRGQNDSTTIYNSPNHKGNSTNKCGKQQPTNHKRKPQSTINNEISGQLQQERRQETDPQHR